MSATNRTGGAERVADDYYITPPWTTRALLDHLDRQNKVVPIWGGEAMRSSPRRILEPGCGEGAILAELRKRYPKAQIIGVELDPERAEIARKKTGEHVITGDFVKRPRLTFAEPFDLVLANPPFSLLLPFFEEMRRLGGPSAVVAVLARVGWAQAGREKDPRRGAFLRERMPFDGRLERRPAFGKNKDGHMGTDGSEYSWLVNGAGREGQWDFLPCESAKAIASAAVSPSGPDVKAAAP